MQADPIELFHEGLARARLSEAFDPTAAALATASKQGTPSVRFVLVKLVDAHGFAFFTNLGSPKSRDLQQNPQAALAFHWSSIGQQVRVRGAVEPVDDAAADAYFRTRPRDSQLGAWASRQSEPIAGRAALDAAFLSQQARFDGQPVPRPPFWGGYRIRPAEIEFWYSREGRMHDRVLYTRIDSGWRQDVLQP